MYKIKQGFINEKGNKYPNIRDIHFEKKSDLAGNLGTFKAETTYEENPFFSSSYKRENGVYIFQSNYDKAKALRIYKDFADYLYTTHDDDELISRLQERQKSVHLTCFPTGIVTVENKIIGQETPYYETFHTIAQIISNNMCQIIPTSLYLEIIKILKELCENGIIYSDIHAKNFMMDLNTMIIRLIDFDPYDISFDNEKRYLYTKMMNTLKDMIKQINTFYNISLDSNFSKTQTLEELEEVISEKHHVIIRKQ